MATKQADELTVTFYNNLMHALENHPGGPMSAAELARKMGVSKSVVSKWTNKQGIASIHQLVTLSQILGHEVGWFLENHSFSEEPAEARPATYTDAFRLLKRLIEIHAIDKDSIRDYFLRYMIRRYYEIAPLKNVSEKNKNAWFLKLTTSYDVPIMEQVDQRMYEFLEAEYQQMDDDQTSLELLHLMQDYQSGEKKKDLDTAFGAWMQKNYPDEYETQEIMTSIKENGAESFFTDPF